MSNPNWLWINYYDGHKEYREAQKKNTNWALKMGFSVKEFNRSSIDSKFYIENKEILDEPLGCGYYLWKPYIIDQALSTIEENDYLVFCDSGSKFNFGTCENLKNFLDINEIALIKHPRPQYQVTKRDVYILMNLDNDKKYINYGQRVSGFIAIKKTPKTVKLVKEWLNYCCDVRIIGDRPNVMGKPNHKGFVRNHHEQTVLSLLVKKHDIPAYGKWNKMVKRHYFLKGEKRPGKTFNQLLKSAKSKNKSKSKTKLKDKAKSKSKSKSKK
tara:strand:+ start:4123 stop:4932 length:810 start_codon:yes stop_codon:yes gene_type:complete